MAEAGKIATNLKRHIEEAESILSQLETPEAKFDYSSYTEPIKKQAQDVTDYTGNFNVALTRYEAKVKELDDTLAKELIAAVPETIQKAFDPSCLLGGDAIHMKGEDIIDTLEAHNSIDIGGKLSDAQLENILAMLFDKKDIDVSGLSREDFEVAFLNLPEEKQKAILQEMGFTRRQIDSILESKESKRSIIDQLCDSKTKNRFNSLIKNNQYAPKTTSKNSGGDSQTTPSAGSSRQSGYNNGTTQCNSQTIGSPGKIDPSFYPSYAEQLIEAQDALCDDDSSNDEDAMKTINECLTAGLYYEDGTLYYDVSYLDYCKGMAGGSLLYSLLDQFDETVLCEDGTLSSFGDYGTYSLTISPLGAGYQLILNADGSNSGTEYSNQRVAYAATEETCKNFFMNGDEYDWDAIEEWCAQKNLIADETEYDFLSEKLIDMEISDINTFLDTAQTWSIIGGYNYKDQVSLLMAVYEAKADLRSKESGDSKYYTKALCCSQVVETVRNYSDIEFDRIKNDEEGWKEYTAYFINYDNEDGKTKEDYITVYPAYMEDTFNKILDDSVKKIVDPSLLGITVGDNFHNIISDLGGCALSVVLSVLPAGIVYSGAMGAGSYVNSRQAFNDVCDVLGLKEVASMYGIRGNVIKKSIGGNFSANIIVESFDELNINAATLYYNTKCDKDITAQELRDSFVDSNEVRDNYNEIYYEVFGNGSGEDRIDAIKESLSTIAVYSSFKLSDITAEQADEVAKRYLKMEEIFEEYCQLNSISAENLEELSEEQFEGLYNESLKRH